MDLFGFHPIDVILLVGYLVLITYISKRSSRKIKSQEDFFLAGRGVSKLFQFFLNMSTITDAGQAVNTAAAAVTGRSSISDAYDNVMRLRLTTCSNWKLVEVHTAELFVGL